MTKLNAGTTPAKQRHKDDATDGIEKDTGGTDDSTTEALPRGKIVKTISRGTNRQASSKQLRDGIWTRALLIANRFRVIRTLDIAACCAPERTYVASLIAAQRAVRGLVKADFLRRYRTDRFQTVYGLSKAGADYLQEQGFDAASSVRRVSDMTNPEHRLWSQFWVLCCEARGLKALTEQELLSMLSKPDTQGKKKPAGMLTANATHHGKEVKLNLVPDAIAYADQQSAVWLEVDRSKRGSAREASLAALYMSVGRQLNDGSTLRTVVIFCKTERIRKCAVAVINRLVESENSKILIDGRRHFIEDGPGIYEVIGFKKMDLADGRTVTCDGRMGHIVIQLLPIWLPKVRVDSSNTHSTAGWFCDNYLPYAMPPSSGTWKTPTSPLLKPIR